MLKYQICCNSTASLGHQKNNKNESVYKPIGNKTELSFLNLLKENFDVRCEYEVKSEVNIIYQHAFDSVNKYM